MKKFLKMSEIKSLKKQINKLTTRLWAGIFLVFLLLISIASFAYIQHVKALINNYDAKGPGSILTAAEWSNLDDDFALPETCAVDQVLKWDGGNWICADASGSILYDTCTWRPASGSVNIDGVHFDRYYECQANEVYVGLRERQRASGDWWGHVSEIRCCTLQ